MSFLKDHADLGSADMSMASMASMGDHLLDHAEHLSPASSVGSRWSIGTRADTDDDFSDPEVCLSKQHGSWYQSIAFRSFLFIPYLTRRAVFTRRRFRWTAEA
jgi:hypothetical protein